MADEFRLDNYLARIGYRGASAADLATLKALQTAHLDAIPFEALDPFLRRPVKLDLASVQAKLVDGNRGGYCYEHNLLLRAALSAVGFAVTGLAGRVRWMSPPDSPLGPKTHMMLKVDLPEGAFLADVGFGNATPTAPLAFAPDLEQQTPHEKMRFIQIGQELTLQSRLGDKWEHIYRVAALPRVDAEFEICNWFTATHPDSPFRNNLIAARPGSNKTRITMFNDRVNIRHASGEVERRILSDVSEYCDVLSQTFGLELVGADVALALETFERNGTRGAHPFFA
jgi:N-hydroxyarylamine O-acetyltransferase